MLRVETQHLRSQQLRAQLAPKLNHRRRPHVGAHVMRIVDGPELREAAPYHSRRLAHLGSVRSVARGTQQPRTRRQTTHTLLEGFLL